MESVKETNMQIAKTILEQLGGSKFVVMVGAKNVGYGDKGISFKFMRNTSGFNYCQITLNAMDTYDVTFIKIWNHKITKEKVINDVYAEQVQSIFSETTGLNTHL